MESESANLEFAFSRTYKESLVAKPVTENQFSNMSLESWNKWVTEQRQEYSQRKKLALLTKENESSSWATPRAGNPGSRPNGKGGKVLAEQAQQSWGTPNTMDMLPPRSPEALARAKKKGGCKNLREEVMQPQNWPTTSVAGLVEGGVAKNVEMTPRGFKATRENGTSYGAKLRDAVIHHEEKNWATPQAFDHVNIVRTPEKLAKTRAEKNAGCMNLRKQVHYPEMDHSRKTARNWPTVQASEARQGYQDRTRGKKGSQKSLTTVVIDGLQDPAKPNTNGKSQESWSTPQARDWKGAEGRAYKGQTKDLPAQTETKGKLNPNWVEQLMGLPVGWTQLPTEWTD
jgi:hypothetical protein